MKKTKMEDLEVLSFVLGVYLLAFKVSYSVTVLWLTLLSLVSVIISIFRIYAPIPMYRENETPYTIPTQRVLPNSLICKHLLQNKSKILHLADCRYKS